VEQGANDGSEACYLQSVYHDRSGLIIEFFLCSGIKLLSGRLDGAEFAFIWGVCLHPSLLGMDGVGGCMLW